MEAQRAGEAPAGTDAESDFNPAHAGLGLTVLTCFLVVVRGRPECDVADWTNIFLAIAAASALGAAICGLLALSQRRWISALISITVAPFFLLLGLLTPCVS